MVSADGEMTTPQIGPPMAHRLNQADQLPLISGKLEVPHRKGAAEERHRSRVLVKDDAEARTGGVTGTSFLIPLSNRVVGVAKSMGRSISSFVLATARGL